MGESLAFIGPWQYVQKVFIIKSEQLYPGILRRKFPVHEVAKILGKYWKLNYRDVNEKINETIRAGLEDLKDILGEFQADDPEGIINLNALDPEILDVYLTKYSRCPRPPTSILLIGEWQYVQKAFLVKAEELYPTRLRKKLPINNVARILSPYWKLQYECIGDKINETIKYGLEDIQHILGPPEVEDIEEIIDLDVTIPEVVNLLAERFDFASVLNWQENPLAEERAAEAAEEEERAEEAEEGAEEQEEQEAEEEPLERRTSRLEDVD